jgi:hypothetical protein
MLFVFIGIPRLLNTATFSLPRNEDRHATPRLESKAGMIV